ncbi:hypothetical protein [Mycobacterium leprae]|uniref:hypothetical protein n=1 Tax=Mycobacterium leprae TaxID=1769 RepID=UPI000AE8C0C9|nr:hypothetical protein [Mycobacterium leprae]
MSDILSLVALPLARRGELAGHEFPAVRDRACAVMAIRLLRRRGLCSARVTHLTAVLEESFGMGFRISGV